VKINNMTGSGGRIAGCVGAAVLALSAVTAGCNRGPAGSVSGAKAASSADADAKMREAMTTGQWDINKVPPEQRERVRALMQQSQRGQQPTAPASKPAPK